MIFNNICVACISEIKPDTYIIIRPRFEKLKNSSWGFFEHKTHISYDSRRLYFMPSWKEAYILAAVTLNKETFSTYVLEPEKLFFVRCHQLIYAQLS